MDQPRPRRVALVASSFHPYTGGVEEHVRHVATHLTRQGVDVEVWTVDRGEHLGTQRVDGVVVRHLPTPLPARDASALVRLATALPSAVSAWMRAHRSFRPDVLHVHCFGPNGVYALAVHRLTGTPMVVTSHGETFADDHGVFDRSALLRRALRASLARACVVTAPTRFVLEDLRDRFGLVGGLVVPNGIDAQAPQEEPVDLPTGRPLVAAVGRVERMKGFDLVLDVMSAHGLESANLAIGGEGSQVEALRAQAEAAGVSERVHLLGRLTPGQVAAVMSAADVVVVPSRREAFGIVALEAWRAGTPLVGTVRGGMPEVVTDGVDGLLVDPTDPEALAGAIRTMLDDRTTAAARAAAGADRVRSFAWASVADRYSTIYAGPGSGSGAGGGE